MWKDEILKSWVLKYSIKLILEGQYIKIYLHNNFDYARLAIKYININENNTVSITIMNIIKSDIAIHKQQAAGK